MSNQVKRICYAQGGRHNTDSQAGNVKTACGNWVKATLSNAITSFTYNHLHVTCSSCKQTRNYLYAKVVYEKLNLKPFISDAFNNKEHNKITINSSGEEWDVF